jgi:hypothetical protein
MRIADDVAIRMYKAIYLQQFPAYKFNYKSMRYDHAENFYSACVEYT